MKKIIKKIFITSVACVAISTAYAQKPCKQVIGYWAGWKDNSSVNYSQYTILNMSFAQPMADGSISVAEYGSKIPGMVSSARAAGAKAMLSIGGWTWSWNFSAIAASQAARQKFASNCASLIQQYGLDGVDIDWEYPNADNGGRPQDVENFPIFLQAIRNAIGGKLLTACFSPA